VNARLVTGGVLMIGVLALIFDIPFMLPVVAAMVGYVVGGTACTATTLLIRWLVKLLLEPVPRAVVALGGSLILHGFAWWDGWHPLSDLLPEESGYLAVVFLLCAHLPAAFLLWRDLPVASPPGGSAAA